MKSMQLKGKTVENIITITRLMNREAVLNSS